VAKEQEILRQDNDEAIDWQAIKTAYDLRQMTVAALCAQHGIAPSRLYRRIREDGWIKRTDTDLLTSPHDGLSRAMLIRLRNVIARRIRSIESMPAGAQLSETVLEGERQARAIAALVRALDQVVALEQRLQSANNGPGSDNDAATATWSTELAKALAALNGTQADAGETEGTTTADTKVDGLGVDGETRPAPADRERG
jgi:hypothetical protein